MIKYTHTWKVFPLFLRPECFILSLIRVTVYVHEILFIGRTTVVRHFYVSIQFRKALEVISESILCIRTTCWHITDNQISNRGCFLNIYFKYFFQQITTFLPHLSATDDFRNMQITFSAVIHYSPLFCILDIMKPQL
jgi:hypothetical protein